jgi:hypothetical protein
MKNSKDRFHSFLAHSLALLAGAFLFLLSISENGYAGPDTAVVNLGESTTNHSTGQTTILLPGTNGGVGTVSTNSNQCTAQPATGTAGKPCCIEVKNPETTSSWFRCAPADGVTCPANAFLDDEKCNDACSAVNPGSGVTNQVIIAVNTDAGGNFNNYISETCALLGGTLSGLSCTIKGCVPGATINDPAKIVANASYAGALFRSWSGCNSVSGRVCTVICPDFGGSKTATATFLKPPPTPIPTPACIPNGSSSAGGICCSGLSCNGVCSSGSSCTSCVPNNSNASGSCCSGNPKCSDGYCRSSCASCVPDGSSAEGTCCSGIRCNGVCSSSSSCGSCVPNNSNATGSCCSGNPKCSDGYCRVSCPSCVPNGSSSQGQCCSGLRCTSGVCSSSCQSCACYGSPECSSRSNNQLACEEYAGCDWNCYGN